MTLNTTVLKMSRKTNAAQIEFRRQKVAANLIGGMNYREIAAALGVSIGTVASDVKIIFARWKGEQVQSAEQWIALELRRCDRLINTLWNDATDGKPGAIDRVLKVMERRAKLLGLDAPTKQDVTSGGERVTFTVRPVKTSAEGAEDGD